MTVGDNSLYGSVAFNGLSVFEIFHLLHSVSSYYFAAVVLLVLDILYSDKYMM